jgi:hypothetical protein
MPHTNEIAKLAEAQFSPREDIDLDNDGQREIGEMHKWLYSPTSKAEQQERRSALDRAIREYFIEQRRKEKQLLMKVLLILAFK